jgi:hypothetical protein
VTLPAATRPEAVIAELASRGASLVSVAPMGATLEDVFVQSVQEGSA